MEVCSDIIHEQPQSCGLDDEWRNSMDVLNRMTAAVICESIELPAEYQVGASLIKTLRSGETDPRRIAAGILASDTLTAACLRAAATISPQFAKRPPRDVHQAVVCIGARSVEALVLRALALNVDFVKNDAVLRILRQWRITSERVRGLVEKHIRDGAVVDLGDWLTPLLLHRIGAVVLATDSDLLSGMVSSDVLLRDHESVVAASRVVIRFYLGVAHVDAMLSPMVAGSGVNDVNAKDLVRAAIYCWNDKVLDMIRGDVARRGDDTASSALEEVVSVAMEGYSCCRM